MRARCAPGRACASIRGLSSGREAESRPNLPVHVEILSSSSNAYVRYVSKLRTNRALRDELQATVLVGDAPVKEFAEHLDRFDALRDPRSFPGSIRTLFCLEGASYESWDGVRSRARRVLRVSKAAMERMAGVSSSEAVNFVAEVDLPRLDTWETRPVRRILALDRVQDPGNVGTLLRTASALGWDGVFLTDGCADVFGDKAMRSSRGVSLRLAIRRGSFEDLLLAVGELGLDAFAADARMDIEAEARLTRRQQQDNSRPICLLLGSEGSGVRDQAWPTFSPIRIAMPGPEESLNVAVAGGILMHLLGR